MSRSWRRRLRLEGTFLASRLGRRIFLMFWIAALVPSIAVFVLTYRAAAREAQQATRVALRAESKFLGMEVYERLQTAQVMLQGYRPGSVHSPRARRCSPRTSTRSPCSIRTPLAREVHWPGASRSRGCGTARTPAWSCCPGPKSSLRPWC